MLAPPRAYKAHQKQSPWLPPQASLPSPSQAAIPKVPPTSVGTPAWNVALRPISMDSSPEFRSASFSQGEISEGTS